MSGDADTVKDHAVERLDREALVHPNKGHQNVHARRYLMPKAGTSGVEIMIVVKGSNLQLWREAEAIDKMTAPLLGGEFRPGRETYQVDTDGKTRYGRHTGLKTMERLNRGDAWRFVPLSIREVDEILTAVKACLGRATSP